MYKNISYDVLKILLYKIIDRTNTKIWQFHVHYDPITSQDKGWRTREGLKEKKEREKIKRKETLLRGYEWNNLPKLHVLAQMIASNLGLLSAQQIDSDPHVPAYWNSTIYDRLHVNVIVKMPFFVNRNNCKVLVIPQILLAGISEAGIE